MCATEGADAFSSSFRCDAGATVQWNPVRLQRGCLPRQSPALLRLQLRVDRSATGHRLRQLPVSCPFSTLGAPPPTPRSRFSQLRWSSQPEVSTAADLKTSFALSAFAHIFFHLYRLETSSDSPSPRFSLLVIYGLVLIISQNAISSCCWRSNRGETSAVTPTTLPLPHSLSPLYYAAL